MSCGLAGRAPTATAPRRRSLSVDESSIKHVAGRAGRPLRRTSSASSRRRSTRRSRRPRSSRSSGPTRRRCRASGTCGSRCATRTARARFRRAIAFNSGNFDSAFKSAAFTVERRPTSTHYTGRMSIGPECCVADVTAERRADLHEHAERVRDEDEHQDRARQGDGHVAAARTGSASPTTRARASTAPPRRTTTRTRRRRSCRQLAGKPVRLQFMRWDTHGWGNYGPARSWRHPCAAWTRSGNLTAFEFTRLHHPSTTRRSAAEQQVTGTAAFCDHGRRSSTTISGAAVLDPEPQGDREARCRSRTTTSRRRRCGLRATRRRRSPRSRPVDELAYMAKMDPVAFRLQNVANADRRSAAAVAERPRPARRRLANWQPKVAASSLVEGRRRDRPRHRVRLLLEHA